MCNDSPDNSTDNCSGVDFALGVSLVMIVMVITVVVVAPFIMAVMMLWRRRVTCFHIGMVMAGRSLGYRTDANSAK